MVTAAPPEKRYVWEPNPRQAEVCQHIADCPEDEFVFIGYGGAAGGAKTNLLAELALEISISCPGARTLVGRQTMKDLKTTTLQEFDKRCPRELLSKAFNSSPYYRQVRMPDWEPGVVSTVYFREVNDAANGIGSEEFGFVLLEEAHEIARKDILYLFSRLRHRPEKKRGMVVAFNPFPSYVVDVFLDGLESFPTEDEDGNPMPVHVHYVPARVADNPHLPANYGQMMRIVYDNDPFLLEVLLEGKSGVVPNAVFPALKDPAYIEVLRLQSLPDWHYTATGEGFDWGTSFQHQSAIVCASREKSGLIVVRDAFMSPEGSSDELYDIGGQFQDAYGATFAAYDRSQGSLEDDLRTKSESYKTKYPEAKKGLFSDVRKGVRDVDGRIRVFRGLLSSDPKKSLVRFDWSKPGVRELWQQLVGYHRDDDGQIVEEKDDLVDAFFYVLWELVRGSVQMKFAGGGGKRYRPPARRSKPGVGI